MSIKTKNYGLTAFSHGDYYSAAKDQDRFTIIDSQLAFVSDLIGPGVISGWEISLVDLDLLSLTISPGMGIVGRTVMQTFGNLDFNVQLNSLKYVYLKKKSDVIGGFSGFSNMITEIGSDDTPPEVPYGLMAVDDLITYEQLAFEWDAWDSEVELDFSHYIVKRIQNDEYSTEEILTTTTETLYIDTGLEQDTEYTYYVIAVDISDNESEPAEITISTNVDTRIPLPPLFIQAFAGNESMQVIWDYSPSDYVEFYEIQIQELDGNDLVGVAIVLPLIDGNSTDDFGSSYAFIENLENDIDYLMSIRSLSFGGQYSEELTVTVTPEDNPGAGEVRNMGAIFARSIFQNIGIETDVSWTFDINEYLDFPDKFLITFVENGGRTSEPIDILEVDASITGNAYSTHLKLIPFNIDGTIHYEPLKQYMPYIIVIQTQVGDDDPSNGVLFRVNRTPVYELLPSITDVAVERVKLNDDILVTWVNPTSPYFDFCKITATIIDLFEGEDDVVYAEDLNIGKVNSYSIPGSEFSVNKRYEFIITPIDIFEEEGDSTQIAKQFIEDAINPFPTTPTGQKLTNGDGQIRLNWKQNATGEIIEYKIYKSTGGFSFSSAVSFILIATVSGFTSEFIDYDVVNDVVYYYIITAVNEYNNESINPVDNDQAPGKMRGVPVQSSLIETPIDLESTVSDRDVTLTWSATAGVFDGYEIFKSIGDKYSFELVGNAFASASSFVDEDALLKDGESYYYIIRKYRNEMTVFITETEVQPENSIFLGTVNTYNSGLGVQVDISDLSIKLANLETLIANTVELRINAHKHNFVDGSDKRIELKANSIITNWTTNDFQVYGTETDISGAEEYILRIAGVVNEDYFTHANGVIDVVAISQAQSGSSPILYEIDSENGIITFATPLYTTCVEPENPDPLDPTNICPVTPYSTEPDISIEILGISEVDNLLTNERIEELNAVQITSGLFDENQLPGVHHSGRLGERLLPLRLPMQSIDNFSYSLTDTYTEDTRNRMGTAVTFYDIIEVGVDGGILAATSSGIWFSPDWGNIWKPKTVFPNPVYRVYQSSENKVYAITNYNVYLSNGGDFGTWLTMSGLLGVKIIRDITEDSTGNIYITTDIGVFRLNKDKPYIEDTWEQLSIFGPRSAEAYGIIYVAEEDTIYSSNELGILESTNEGNTWSYVSEISTSNKVFRFFREGNYIFAITNNAVFRKEVGVDGFIKIADINDISLCRQIIIYNDNIYITTDIGVKVSNTDDIYTNTDISFIIVWKNIRAGVNRAIVTSLNLLDDDIFIGSERKLFIQNLENFWLQYEQANTIIPSIFVNAELQKIGFYYNNEGTYHNIVFDEQVAYENVVDVANKYDIYVVENGGWVQQKFDSSVKLWKNGIFLSESTEDIEVAQNPFILWEFPEFDDTNSNLETATEAKALLDDNLTVLSGLTLPTDDELVALITDTYNNYQKFSSQLYSTNRVVVTSTGETENFVFPEIIIPMVNKSTIVNPFGNIEYVESETGDIYNVVNGQFTFAIGFDKNDDLTIDVYGSTVDNAGELSHRDLEDEFELINSGLPSGLSQIQQVNNIKLGIFNEITWPGEQDLVSPPLQAEYIIPDDTEWYDTLNSTINYELEIEVEEVSSSIIYPTTVFYVPEVSLIYVGGKGGVLSVDIDTLDIEEISFLTDTEIIRQINRNGDNLYAITDKNLYLSSDYGVNWEEISRAGLPNALGAITFSQNKLIVGAEDGIYFRPSELSDWQKSIDSEKMVELFATPDLLFAIIDNKIYLSGDGYNFTDLGISDKGNITQIIKHGASFYVSSDTGLYSDAGSFYSGSPELTQIELEEKSDYVVNDLYSDGTNLGIGVSDGSYYILNTEGMGLNEFSFLTSIHKILLISEEAYLFGFDHMKVPDIDLPIRLTTGVPM